MVVINFTTIFIVCNTLRWAVRELQEEWASFKNPELGSGGSNRQDFECIFDRKRDIRVILGRLYKYMYIYYIF